MSELTARFTYNIIQNGAILFTESNSLWENLYKNLQLQYLQRLETTEILGTESHNFLLFVLTGLWKAKEKKKVLTL